MMEVYQKMVLIHLLLYNIIFDVSQILVIHYFF
jgi:hypothetical protein